MGRRIGMGGSAAKALSGQIEPLPDGERQIERADLGEHRIGHDAAREIAEQIESKGGFWGPRR